MLRILLATFITAFIAFAARGQPGPWAQPFERAFHSKIDPRKIDLADEVIGLSDAQRAALEGMLKAHEERFAAYVAHWKPIHEELVRGIRSHPRQSPQELEAQMAYERTLRQAADEQAALDERFLSDMLPFLTDQQVEQHAVFVRHFNRHRWLQGLSSRHPECVVDLVAFTNEFVTEHAITPGDALLESLASYEIRLDVALREKVDSQRSLLRRWLERDRTRFETDGTRVWMGPGTDADLRRTERESESHFRLVTAVRDINKETAAIVRSLLPEAWSDRFEAEYLQQVLRPSIDLEKLPLVRYAHAAKRLPSLTAEQQEAISSILAEHVTKQRAAERAILAALDLVNDTKLQYGQNAQRRSEKVAEEAIAHRKAIDDAIIKVIDSMLEPDQREVLAPLIGE